MFPLTNVLAETVDPVNETEGSKLGKGKHHDDETCSVMINEI
jgi:hypothetical protein